MLKEKFKVEWNIKMNGYQHWKNLVKPVLYTGLAAIVYAGCVDKVPLQKQTPKQEQKKVYVQEPIQNSAYSFSNFGEIENVLWYRNGPYTVAVGDMDGDGDLDLIVGSNSEVDLFENKIPQKNKMKELPTGPFP